MPKRFQIKCSKGWKKPVNGVVVARPGKWGNPFKISEILAREQALAKFERYLADMPEDQRRAWLEPLHGKDLGCWCPLDLECHADVLLRWANR